MSMATMLNSFTFNLHLQSIPCIKEAVQNFVSHHDPSLEFLNSRVHQTKFENYASITFQDSNFSSIPCHIFGVIEDDIPKFLGECPLEWILTVELFFKFYHIQTKHFIHLS